ncbi:MAG: B12-binding domain-containing radical SAM protein [Candidatus Omnitrophica bacterium]|nr:B12-binding domain-containing radical SAM protein [Candidatus Omnitrophota bacterium]
MSDVVLVYPRSDSIEPAMNHFYLPLALLNCSVYVSQDFSVKIIDQRTDRNWKNTLISELNTRPLCVGITSLTGDQIAYALEATRLVKIHSDIPVIWGGVHATILPEQTLMNPQINFVLEGEGELSFYEFVKALAKGKPFKDIPGLWYKENGSIKNNPCGDYIDINSLPDPPYHLVDIENYILRFGKYKMFPVETARGCPYRCTFCFVQKSRSQRKWRALTPENIISRIKRVKSQFGVRGIEFLDLESFIDQQRIKKLCELIIREDLNIFWNACARINDILKMNTDEIRLLEKSGLKRLALGIESGSNRILNMIKKDITVDQVMVVSDILAKTKIPAVYSFMAGFPTETETDLKMTTDLVMELLKCDAKAKVSILHCFRPLPGTKLYELCINLGLKVPSNIEEWSRYNMEKIDFPWLSDKMQKKIFTLNFLSLFIDRKFEEVDNIMVHFFARIYKFIARHRFAQHDFRLFFEPYLKDIFIKLKQ